MKKIFGLDIGITSIGWAVVKLSDTNKAQNIIEGLGSRIIPLSNDEESNFTKGASITTNSDRTLKRTTRKSLDRYQLRKQSLKALFKTLNIEVSKDLFGISALELYGLRANAVVEQISLPELGRIWFHLNQKRGYKSSRKTNNEENSKSDYLTAISDREKLLQQRQQTIGQFFFEELQDAATQNLQYTIKKNIFNRHTYIAEFETIYNTQQKYYPHILTEELREKVRDEIIYFQRKLKSAKHLVGECRFEKHHKTIPISSPLNQLFRITQDINQLELEWTENRKTVRRKLNQEEKKLLFDKLQSADKLTKSQVLELLQQPKRGVYLNLKKEIKGNLTTQFLQRALTKAGIDSIAYTRFNLIRINSTFQKTDTETGEITTETYEQINSDFEKEPLFQLWHLIYSIDEPEKLNNALQKRYGMTKEQAVIISDVTFPQDFGSLSSRAIRKLLPALLDGQLYDKACNLVGYRHSDYETSRENALKELLPIADLQLLKRNALRNPVVEKIVNHTINLVKAIYAEYGEPDEIRIELARELKSNIEERKNMFDSNNRAKKRHDEIERTLQQQPEFAGRRVSRKDIERYKLWEEFEHRSPYEPDKVIGLAELFSGGYDVDHIIPQSRMFDDSYSNKVIARRSINELKGNATGYDYMQSKGEGDLKQYVDLVQAYFDNRSKDGKIGISKTKKMRLLTPAAEIPTDFISRQLRETQYITKKIREILSTVNQNVTVTSGGITDYLRHLWGYNEIIHDLNFPRFKEHGQTEMIEVSYRKPDGQIAHKSVEKIKDWGKRNDHRHHAVDALVIACTKQGYIQRLNALNQITEGKQNGLKEADDPGTKRYFQSEIPFKFDAAMKAVESILISFKTGKKVAVRSTNKYRHSTAENKKIHTQLIPKGLLHKETVYGSLKEYKKISIDAKLTKDKTNFIIDSEVKELVLKHLAENQNDPKKAFKKPLLHPVSNKEIKEATIYEIEYTTRTELNDAFKPEWVKDIVDATIRNLVQKRLASFKNNPKGAFIESIVHPSGFPVKRVTLKTGYSDLTPLHKDENGNSIDFVQTRNNHHMAIYKDNDGKLQAEIVSFWEAFERKKQGLPLIRKQHPEGWNFVTSLQQNELFILGLDSKEIDITDSKFKPIISRHLYRVQKLSVSPTGSIDLFFRHHLETELIDSEVSKQMKRFIRIRTLQQLNGIKTSVNGIGNIKLSTN